MIYTQLGNAFACGLDGDNGLLAGAVAGTLIVTNCMLPSRHGVLSLGFPARAASHCTRSSDSAGRVM
jgi:hypothetical protein